VLVAAIVAAVLLLHGGGGGSFVPTTLVGEPQATAVAQVKAAGLNPSVVQQSNASVTAGNVISTNPSAGSSISKGGTVTLYVSKGAGTILLPSVQNEQANAAEQQLHNLGFTNVQQQPFTSSLPSGEVDHMSPAANQKYAPSQPIVLYVSGGDIAVPTLTGVPLSTAEAELKSYGFTSQPSVQFANGPISQNIPVGTVWNQFPAPGKNEPPNTVITLFVQQTAASPTTSPSTSPPPSTTPSPSATPTSTITPTGPPTGP
jgi:beta-lactam-binding protein with PASTA domain